jgi:uncharacterized phage protein (predicted DNA packaging)
MTAQTAVNLLKLQINLDHDLDDELLAHKLAAAEIWIANHTGIAFDGDNAAMTEAALQLAGYWYECREAANDVSLRPVPFGVRDLLSSFRDEVTGHVAE